MKTLLFFLLTAAAALPSVQSAQLAGYDASTRNPALPTQAGAPWRYFGSTSMTHAGAFLRQDFAASGYGYFATPTTLPAGTFNIGVADYGISVTVQPQSNIPFAGGSDYANILVEWQDGSHYYTITLWTSYGVTYGPSGASLFPVDWSRPRTIFIGYNHGPDTFSFFLDGQLMTTVSRTTLITGANFIGANQMCFGDATTGGPVSQARWYSAGVFDQAVPAPVVVPLVEYDAQRQGVSPDLASPVWEYKGVIPMLHNGQVLVQEHSGTTNGHGNYFSPKIHGLMKAGKGQYGIEFRVKPLSDMLSAGSSYYANLMVAWGDEQDTFRVSIDRNFPSPGSSTGALLGNGDSMTEIVSGIDWSQPRTIYIGYSGPEDVFDFYIDNQWVKRVPAANLTGGMVFDARFTGRVGFGDFTSGQVAPFHLDLKAEWSLLAIYDRAGKNPERVDFSARKSGVGKTPAMVGPAWTQAGTAMTNNGAVLVQDTTPLAPANSYGNYLSPKVDNLMWAGESDYAIEFRVKPQSDLLSAGSSYYANLMVAWGDNQRTFRVSIDKNHPGGGSGTGALLGNGDTMTKIIDGIDWTQSRLVQIGYSGDDDRFNFFVDHQWKGSMAANDLSVGAAAVPGWSQRVAFGDFTSGQVAPNNLDVNAEWTSVGVRDRASEHAPVLQYHARRNAVTPDQADPTWTKNGLAMTASGTVLAQNTTGLAPGNGYGNYVSPRAHNLMVSGAGEYGIEFRVKPLSDMLAAGSSYYANLMVAWSDDLRTYAVSIDRNYPTAGTATGALLGNGNTMTKLADGIDWSKPHTVYIGYSGVSDQFEIFVDNQLTKTISASSLSSGLAYEPTWSQRVAFGDFTSGQSAPNNVDLRADWTFVGIYDRAKKSWPRAEAPAGTVLSAFSQLSSSRQQAIRAALAPPALSARENPYASAMYYPMWGLTNGGLPVPGSSPDGQYHPEWQQALIQDWAALGIRNLHINVFPEGNGYPTRSYVLPQSLKTGLANLGTLAAQNGMRIILRADPPGTAQGYWPANPRNPSNELASYLGWLEDIIDELSGQVYAIIPGDEIAENTQTPGQEWTLADFRQFVVQVADGIHLNHPNIKVSTPAFGTGSWSAVLGLFTGTSNLGTHADAIAINLEDTAVAEQYGNNLAAHPATSGLEFFANGVGYVSSSVPRNPTGDNGYYAYNDSDQAGMIAQAMYHCWAAGMQNAPYYTVLRSMIYHGTSQSMYYGFFGFMDLNIATNGQASIIRAPGWYAFQTIATTFFDTQAFQSPGFPVRSTNKRTGLLAAHERIDGKELILVLTGEGSTDVEIDSDQYTVPVRIDLLNKDSWTDLPATQSGKRVTVKGIPLQGARIPVIVRVISKNL